ncbi:MAG: prolyl oligopeptidase family serine peptidase [Rhodocyclaceae bacterium]|nr:prolyl oligopeptidase family serine peptidase [Rhodocyclaceae bacterium]
MKNLLRLLRFTVLSILVVIALGGALFGYFIYSPDPEMPPLSGTLTKASIEVGGLKRTYRTYIPKGLPKSAPLVVVMHGSGQNGAQIRLETGYGFERLADSHGFAVVYPNAYTFDWNDCSKVGDFSIDGVDVDDVGFLNLLVDKLIAEVGVDHNRVFATGVSAGGFMSIRLALEASTRFRAVAAVSANVPSPENFKCTPMGQGASVMIMNGTKDPLVPFDGGESSLFGLFFKGGNVRSARESVQYFADHNHIVAPPTLTQSAAVDGVGVEQLSWRDTSAVEVELVTIHGGGHGLPQPYWRRPRLLGPSPMAPNGPEIIWAFFERQRPLGN